MKRTKRTWIAVLVGVLLLATLVGVVWARPKSHHGGFHYTATVPGGHFHSRMDGQDYYMGPEKVYSNSGPGSFTAAAPILPGNRTVESVTMYVMDHSSSDVWLGLFRTKTDGTKQQMASISSSGSSASIRSFSTTSISPDRIWGGHGACLELIIMGTNIEVYAVQITYY